MLSHDTERAYLIREVRLKTPGCRKAYEGKKLPRALKHYGKLLKKHTMVGSVVLTISEMVGDPKNTRPKETATYAVISDTDGELYLTVPRHG